MSTSSLSISLEKDMDAIQTQHKVLLCNACETSAHIPDKSVALVVTSPPYPMIQMWDDCFSLQDTAIRTALNNSDFNTAFTLMHNILNVVWGDVDRVLIDGGIVCINIGDATRNCNGNFKMFPNHAAIIEAFIKMGYSMLPDIHWHKPTNTPNKFMGSGMYPSGAYVTYEHEYILIFRKGNKRIFSQREKDIRHESAYFWEERNVWFSDLWKINGVNQGLLHTTTRARSAAFPFEVAYRLINMFSIKGDTVYDPFLGTGTTLKAALASERNSIGCEIDEMLCLHCIAGLDTVDAFNGYISYRLIQHSQFIDSSPAAAREKMYFNQHHNTKVKTQQEIDLRIRAIKSIDKKNNILTCKYSI